MTIMTNLKKKNISNFRTITSVPTTWDPEDNRGRLREGLKVCLGNYYVHKYIHKRK